MKNAIIILLVGTIMLMLVSIRAADGPWLVCDPVTDATHYEVTINGQVETVPAFGRLDGTVMLKYNLGDLEDGPHIASVKAINLWGMSGAATKDFIKALPGVPVNVRTEG